MASLHIYHNPPPGGKNKLAGGVPKAPIKDNSTFTPFLVVFQALTPTLAQNLTFVLVLSAPGIYTDVNLQRVTGLALK